MLNTSFEPWPSFTQEEADAVSRTILSNKVNYWTGTECREFEKAICSIHTDKICRGANERYGGIRCCLKSLKYRCR